MKTINDIRTKTEQLITVVGCGGNRDKTKRPIMAGSASELSDKVILTSDNPGMKIGSNNKKWKHKRLRI
jgi:UDP-N-acetylmuramoyl-L-alanyl-D-glutamate--2,6-diaminopimelate ligase